MSKQTEYSTVIEGTRGNYNWPVTFDITGGFIGINQTHESGIERVLLSPLQIRELIEFVKRHQVKPMRELKRCNSRQHKRHNLNAKRPAQLG